MCRPFSKSDGIWFTCKCVFSQAKLGEVFAKCQVERARVKGLFRPHECCHDRVCFASPANEVEVRCFEGALVSDAERGRESNQ